MKLQMNLFLHKKVHVKVQKRLQVGFTKVGHQLHLTVIFYELVMMASLISSIFPLHADFTVTCLLPPLTHPSCRCSLLGRRGWAAASAPARRGSPPRCSGRSPPSWECPGGRGWQSPPWACLGKVGDTGEFRWLRKIFRSIPIYLTPLNPLSVCPAGKITLWPKQRDLLLQPKATALCRS